MLGTKHEKTVIIILAYIIGFTSCFIAFGVSPIMYSEFEPIQPLIDETNFYMEETLPVETTTTPTNLTDNEIVSYADGRLYAMAGGSRYVLSFDATLIEDGVKDSFSEQGMHISPPSFVASPDGKFVFFCETQTTDDSCLALIFDTTANVIQFLNHNGSKVTVTTETAAAAMWSNGSLSLGQYLSVSNTEPWTVTTQ